MQEREKERESCNAENEGSLSVFCDDEVAPKYDFFEEGRRNHRKEVEPGDVRLFA